MRMVQSILARSKVFRQEDLSVNLLLSYDTKRAGLAECVFCLIIQVGKIFTQFCLSSREDHPLAITTRIKQDLAKHLLIKLHSVF